MALKPHYVTLLSPAGPMDAGITNDLCITKLQNPIYHMIQESHFTVKIPTST